MYFSTHVAHVSFYGIGNVDYDFGSKYSYVYLHVFFMLTLSFMSKNTASHSNIGIQVCVFFTYGLFTMLAAK